MRGETLVQNLEQKALRAIELQATLVRVVVDGQGTPQVFHERELRDMVRLTKCLKLVTDQEIQEAIERGWKSLLHVFF